MKMPLLLALGGRCCGQSPVPLSQLLAEALQENPDLKAGEHTWRAATHTRDQVMALPDPQFTGQEFSVGSPRPFAGLNASNFAYLGIGASQELPYPGKRNLKGQAADAAANVEYAKIGVLQASLPIDHREVSPARLVHPIYFLRISFSRDLVTWSSGHFPLPSSQLELD